LFRRSVLKTTRIKALQGEEVVISNTELTSTRVQNFKKLKERRVVYKIGVEYGTSINKLKKIPETIEKVINKQKNTRFDRAHFMEFGDSSLMYEVVYYALTPDYNEYMDLHQKILFGTLEGLTKLKVAIAYPTQTIFLQSTPK
jgi:small-conductance mechanosensitive channel